MGRPLPVGERGTQPVGRTAASLCSPGVFRLSQICLQHSHSGRKDRGISLWLDARRADDTTPSLWGTRQAVLSAGRLGFKFQCLAVFYILIA